MTWRLAEDQAIKNLVSGLTVQDRNGTYIPVPVWFRMPDDERRAVEFPFITVDFIDMVYVAQRDERGRHALSYLVSESPAARAGNGHPYTVTSRPLPFELVYQITVYTRTAIHDTILFSRMMNAGRIPIKHGYVYVPEDETYRRVWNRGVVSNNYKEGENRRVFRKMYTVAVETELLPEVAASVPEVVVISPTIYTFDLVLHRPTTLSYSVSAVLV